MTFATYKAVFGIRLRSWSKNSNISLDRCRGLFLGLAVLLLLQGPRPASALDGKRSLAQYVHSVWGVDKGYIGGAVYSMAQSSDGFLWLGTEHGLVRFDGFEFTLIQAPLTDQRRIGAVRGLVEDADGTLWIRLDGPRLLRYRDGIFEDAVTKLAFHDTVLTAMSRDNAGNMLLWGIQKRLMRFRGDQFQRLLSQDAVDIMTISIAESNSGSLWLGTQNSGLYRVDRGETIQILPDALLRSVNVLAPSEQGGVWIGSETGLHLWENGALVPLDLPLQLHAQVSSIVRDHNHNIWVGTDGGLYRLDSDRKIVTGFYRRPDDPRISSIYEDSAGDVWFAGSRGVERFRDGMFTTISSRETSLRDIGGPLFADDAGRTWFAPVGGGLYCLENGSAKRVSVSGLDNDVIYSIDGSKDELWLGRQQGGLTQLTLHGNQWVSRTFTQRDGLAQNSVYTVTRARDGSIWAGTVSGGISVLRNGRFETYTINNGLPSNAIFSSLEGSDKKMWFASSSGLMSFDGTHWLNFQTESIFPHLDVRTIFEDSGHVLWVGTTHGLVRFNGKNVKEMDGLPQILSEEVLSIGEDAQGFLWVVTDQHILQIDRTKLLSGNLGKDDVLSYGIDDGLTETEGVRRDRSLVSDSAGRIWISLLHSLAVADLRSASGYPQPVSVRVDSVLTDEPSPQLGQNPNLPANTRSVTFRYGGTNLAMPERTRFRYRLDGLYQNWSEGGSSRLVVFTPLSPGTHTFRIMASNALGVWNGPEKNITFTVLPAFWQTWYFRALCVVMIGALCIALYRFRLMQVTGQLNRRFQDRLAERTRIAQDLHDTLLQGVISTSMQLDVAQDDLPENSPTRQTLHRLLQQMRQVIEEGRGALHGLRTIDSSMSLETAFRRMAEELDPVRASENRVHVEGQPYALKSAVYDEVYRIGREAYINAVAHASAKQIEITVDYGLRSFRLRVEDDGCGIGQGTLAHGREGHWGLAGMRERAAAIGSDLIINTRTPGGTDVELRVPIAIAYLRPNTGRIPWLWRSRRTGSQPKDHHR